MTFLQPIILWGLPLILLPILIHLFNRLRHRPMPWAAMMFLRSATRKSTRYARLRQFLVLLFRVLAVLALILAVSRPLAGGWMGWMAAGAPDTILVLLDRSASMEAHDLGRQTSKRQEAVELIAKTAAGLGASSKVVLIDSATRAPQAVDPVSALAEFPQSGPTETGADLPAQLQAALDWITQNKPGSAEIWIASDLQRSNWRPDSDRWPALAAALAALPQTVRVRLLALNREPEGNLAVAVREANRRSWAGDEELNLVLDLDRDLNYAGTVPVSLSVDGAPSQLEIKMDGTSLRYRHRIPLSGKEPGGWGKIELPADVNPSDNAGFFVYGPPPRLRSAVVAADDFCRRLLPLTAAPDPANTNRVCDVFKPEQAETVDWEPYALVLWQGTLPKGSVADDLKAYVEKGGLLLFFPSGEPGLWDGAGWGEIKEATGDQVLAIERWDQTDGPLANSEEGLALPVEELDVKRRQAIVGDATVLAWFKDGSPLLARRVSGRGQILYMATLPRPDWSRLDDGAVLVPMVQRLLDEGGRRLSSALMISCGDTLPPSPDGPWLPVADAGGLDPRFQAGVYRSSNRWLAVNRPVIEEDRDGINAGRAGDLFGAVPFQMFEEKRSGPASLQSELWRWFLVGMLLFLLVEAVLILPERTGGRDLRPPVPERRFGVESKQTVEKVT
jgi:Aerotolerance regulator N-terminal